ncbi:Bestrophin-3 [Nymphon striatum]|nr:Bestrophin-3 [Nymphon striatum]
MPYAARRKGMPPVFATRLRRDRESDVIDAARDVMDAVRDVIPVACEALPSKMLLLLWLRSIPCFNATAATREALIMTVSYTLEVSNAGLCGFAKLLLRWRGSIYKLMLKEMIMFIGLYYNLSIIYRYALSADGRIIFEKISIYCKAFSNLIPISFVLGFYVAIVVHRWWEQVLSVPSPDKYIHERNFDLVLSFRSYRVIGYITKSERFALLVSTYIHGSDERSRIIRRTLIRYVNLTIVMTFQLISTAVKKRFPTIDHIQEAGLMTNEERSVYDVIVCPTGKWWVPIAWSCSLISRANKEGRIKNEVALDSLIQEVYNIRSRCGKLFLYDWISVPLVYTQVVTLAIYTFFLSTLMGRQYLDPNKGYPDHDVDLYVPVFTILQFFFYMGWLKVAEQLINPFGEDDDDYETNYIIDRIIQVPFLIVDEMHLKHPKIVKDTFWDDVEPKLPYTKSTVNNKIEPFLGSTAQLNDAELTTLCPPSCLPCVIFVFRGLLFISVYTCHVDPEEQEFLPMNSILEDDSAENTYLGSGLISAQNSRRQSTGKLFLEIRDSKILNYLLGQRKNEQSPSISSSYEFKKEARSFMNPLYKMEPTLHRSPSDSKTQLRRKEQTRSIAGSMSGLKSKRPSSDFKRHRTSIEKSIGLLGSYIRGHGSGMSYDLSPTVPGNKKLDATLTSTPYLNHVQSQSYLDVQMQAKSTDNIQSHGFRPLSASKTQEEIDDSR